MKNTITDLPLSCTIHRIMECNENIAIIELEDICKDEERNQKGEPSEHPTAEPFWKANIV